MNILIAESQQSLAQAIGSVAMKLGHAPLFASTRQLLHNISQDSFTLMIVDIGFIGDDIHYFINKYRNIPIIVTSSQGSAAQAKKVLDAGAVDYFQKPFQSDELCSAIRKVESQMSELSSHQLSGDTISPTQLPSIRSNSKMKKLARILHCVSASSVTVLISGESGTGKEVVARYLCDHGTNPNAPFIAINCAAIPENLLEAELFGAEKGAYTGANQTTIGKFEMAAGGTILLDEVSEMSLALQSKFLRVLQEREFYRVGGQKVIRVDARVAATTNRDLLECVKQGSFREDLYYRLNVIPVHIPSLRERPDDAVILAKFFLEKCQAFQPNIKLSFSNDAISAIKSYEWPGNIRELENAITRVAMLCECSDIHASDLELGEDHVQNVYVETISSNADSMNLDTLETATIIKALKVHGGNRTHAAQTLGISIRTLRNKIKEYQTRGLDVPCVIHADSVN